MSLPLLSADAFRHLLELADADAPIERPYVPDVDSRRVADSLEEQFFVEWEVPQAS